MSSLDSSKYSIILPTYNEAENLPLIISLIDKHLSEANVQYEVIIVDDSSPDGTFQIAQNLQTLFGENKIILLSRPAKSGLGSAYFDGMRKCSGDFVFLMDADLSHHPRHLVEFIAKQKKENVDIVTGTRYALGGGIAGWDLKRILISRGANLLATLLLNPGLSDLTGSYRLYKKHVLEDLMSKTKSRAYVFQMEIIVRAKRLGYKVAESPIVFVDRLYGVSKLGATEIVSYLRGLWDLFLDL
jgi:dolichol-phosphate mannosyltransferase